MERWRLVARNPTACAHFFDVFMRSFIVVFLGFTDDANVQTNPDCIFGTVLGYFFKPEGSGRGGLHGHGNVIQPHLQAARIRAAIRDGGLHRTLVRFMESLQQQCLPTPYFSRNPEVTIGRQDVDNPIELEHPGAGSDFAARRFDVPALSAAADAAAAPHSPSPPASVTHDEAAADAALLLAAVVAARGHVPGALHEEPADGSTVPPRPTPLQAAMTFVAEAVLYLQIHKHSHTCAKKNGEPNDIGCRLRNPRPAHRETVLLNAAHAVVVLKRCCPMFVPYLPALMLAQPCNQAVYLAIDQGIWERECVLAQESGRDPPPLLDAEDASHDMASYSSKYSTKADGQLLNDALLNCVLAMTAPAASGRGGEPVPEPSGGLFVATIVLHAVCSSHFCN